MQILNTLFAYLPNWLLPVGWVVLLVGWALGRPTTSSFLNKVSVFGVNNTTVNQVSHEASRRSDTSGDSRLSKAGSWASLMGLVLTLLPMLKDWLK